MADKKYVTKYPVPDCVGLLELVLKEKYSISSKDIAKEWYSLEHPNHGNTPDVKDEIAYISGYISIRMFSKLKGKGIMSKVGRKYKVDLEACQTFYEELVASKQGESTAAS